MGFPNSQLTTISSAKYQLTTIFLANSRLTTNLVSYSTVIPRARMGSESIAHEAEARMGY